METEYFPDEAIIISQDNSSSSKSSSVEITAMRRRLNTEETFRIHNHNHNDNNNGNEIMQSNANILNHYSHYQISEQQEGRLFYRREEDNLDLSVNNDDNALYPSVQYRNTTELRTMNEDDDGDSLVSALTAEEEDFSNSNSDRKQQLISRFFRGGSGGDEVFLPSLPPPIEVTTTTPRNTNKSLAHHPSHTDSKMEELIADLALQRSTSTSSHHHNHNPPRPDLINRTISCPTKSAIPENSPIVINGIALNGTKHKDNNDDDDNTSNIFPEIVGGRKRRVHRRVKSGAEISVGSLVGQSTLLTESTVAGSSFTGGVSSSSCCYSEDASSVRRTIQNFRQVSAVANLLLSATGTEDGIGCCSRSQQQQGSKVKKELKYVVKKVTAPIRMIPLFKEKKTKLKRSTTGSLV